jgi:hypothetical protein
MDTNTATRPFSQALYPFKKITDGFERVRYYHHKSFLPFLNIHKPSLPLTFALFTTPFFVGKSVIMCKNGISDFFKAKNPFLRLFRFCKPLSQKYKHALRLNKMLLPHRAETTNSVNHLRFQKWFQDYFKEAEGTPWK